VAHRGRQNADDLLAAELAAGKTVRDAATAAGVAERTAHRRRTDADFKARIIGLRAALVYEAVSASPAVRSAPRLPSK